MKKINKNNLFMYVLVVLAVVMLSSTLTMAVLTDRKKGKEDLVFGRVAISGENSRLEVVIDETITQDSEILNQDRYLYFSPTADTEDMIVRFKVEYKTDAEGYDEQLAILNATLTDPNCFVPYYDETAFGSFGYTYMYKMGYFYLVYSDAMAVNMNDILVLTSYESDMEFIICNDYFFHIENKADQASVFTNLMNVNLKLVVTIEAAQFEGLESLEDVWPLPEVNGVSIYTLNSSLMPVSTGMTLEEDEQGRITLPASIAGYSGQSISIWEDYYGHEYPVGATIEVSDLDDSYIDETGELVLMPMFAGLIGLNEEPESSEPVGIASDEYEFHSWSELVADGIFTVNNGKLLKGTSQNYIEGYLYLPRTITSISDTAFDRRDQYDSSCANITGLVCPDTVTEIGNIYNNGGLDLQHFVMFDSVTTLSGAIWVNEDYSFYEDGFYYVGNALNPYLYMTGYNWNYFENHDFILNVSNDTKFISSNVLSRYMEDNESYYDEHGEDLEITLPANYSIIGEELRWYNFNENTRAPFITNDNGVIYLKSGNNAHYNLFKAYTILSGNTITLHSDTRKISELAFESVWFDTEGDGDFNVVLNEGLTIIDKRAFARSNVAEVTLSSTITSIDDYAFSGCYYLATVSYSQQCNLTTIGMGAFSDCSSLTSLTIPASVTSIGDYAFIGSSITSFTTTGNARFSVLDGKFFTDTTTHTLLHFLYDGTTTSVEIPSGITTISMGAFAIYDDGYEGTNRTKMQTLDTITIPSTVTGIRVNTEYSSEYGGPTLFTAYLSNLYIESPDFYEVVTAMDSNYYPLVNIFVRGDINCNINIYVIDDENIDYDALSVVLYGAHLEDIPNCKPVDGLWYDSDNNEYYTIPWIDVYGNTHFDKNYEDISEMVSEGDGEYRYVYT